MPSPQPLLSAVGAVAGPGSVTSTRAHRGAARTVTVNVPASPAADQCTGVAGQFRDGQGKIFSARAAGQRVADELTGGRDRHRLAGQRGLPRA
jgi:hypothetical protein